MSYRDPYAEQYGRTQQQYNDGPEYNPYSTNQPHQTYDQGGYDPYYAAPGGYRDEPNFARQGVDNVYEPQHLNQTSGMDQNDFGAGTSGKGPQNVRQYRHNHQGVLWTRGGRGRCIGRFCCCTLLVIIFLVISILLALAMWITPPNIVVGTVGPQSTGGSEIQLQTDGVQVNLGANISVNNPNYFQVSFSKIDAQIFYPINNTLIGNGSETDITFPSHTQKNFTFPFSIEYTTTMPSSTAIIDDLATKCGVSGTTSDITVDYKITLGLRILFFTVSPVISNSVSFPCPLSASDLKGLLPGL